VSDRLFHSAQHCLNTAKLVGVCVVSCLDLATTSDVCRYDVVVSRSHRCAPVSPAFSVRPSPASAAAASVGGRRQLHWRRHRLSATDLFHR